MQQLIAGVAGYDAPGRTETTQSPDRAALPASLRALMNDPFLSEGLDNDWLKLLLRADYCGTRPRHTTDWYVLFRLLQRTLPDETTRQAPPSHPAGIRPAT